MARVVMAIGRKLSKAFEMLGGGGNVADPAEPKSVDPKLMAGQQTVAEQQQFAKEVAGPALSPDAKAVFSHEAQLLEMHPLTLAFRSPGLEGQYLADVANRRWPVYIFIFCFDVACYSFRLTAKRLRSNATSATVLTEVAPQLANMAMLYIFLGLLNGRSRRMGARAARQEEYLLITVMAFAICCLLTTLRAENAQDYVFGGYFLICTTSFLKIRWLVGTTVLAAPIALVHFWYRRFTILPVDAEVHLLVAWAVGGLMSFLADTYRRQMFANHKLAATAAEKEIHEARARAEAQRLLAGAQAQAAQRALIVAREKAANEAKSEFMSLMCHEVRTPLNGCLASAEMLLETPLEEEQRELAKTIRVSGSILLSTVSNFLDFFKMEAGKQLDVVRTEIDVQELVSDVHCIIEAMIGRGCGVTLMRPHMPGVPEYALGDPDRLRGILLNLYTNAAKFTKRGAISLRVSVAGPNFRPKPHELHTFSATSSRRSTDEGSIRLSSTSGAERSTAEGVARRHQVAARRSASWAASTRQLAGSGGAPSGQSNDNLRHRSMSEPVESLCSFRQQHISETGACNGIVTSQPMRAGSTSSSEAQRRPSMQLNTQSSGQSSSSDTSTSTHGQTNAPLEAGMTAAAASALGAATGAVISASAAGKAADGPPASAMVCVAATAAGVAGMLVHDQSHSAAGKGSDKEQGKAGQAGASSAGRQSDTEQGNGGDAGTSSAAVEDSEAAAASSGLPAAHSQGTDRSTSGSSAGGASTAQGRTAAEALPGPSHLAQPEPQQVQEQSTPCGPPTAGQVPAMPQTRPSDSGDNADLGVAPTSIASGGQSPAASGVDPSASCGPGSVSTSDATRSSSLEAPTTPETSASPARVQPVLTSDGERTAAASSSGQDSGPGSGLRPEAEAAAGSGSSESDDRGMRRDGAAQGAESSSIGSDSDQYGDQADQARRDSHIEASTSGRSAGNTGRRSSGGSRVQPQMKSVERLGNGWCSVVSANPAATQAGHDLSNHQQWLVFEVADMGVGIAEEGLQRLFREYVQGTEDEMRQPRRRGGTGLGLSICSKQVAVLGGQIGAMSKRDCGSTFWFTIPLIMPAPSERGRTSEMRRVASWCSRDAFSDGHLRAPEPHEAEARLKGATSRAHSFRKYHHSQRATRSTSYVSVTEAQRAFAQEDAQASVQNSLLYSNRGASSHQSEPASRRRSAPQEDRVIDPGFLPDVAVAVAAAQRVERLAQPVSAADKRMGTPQAGTPAAKSAAARAALLSAPAPAPTTEAASMRNPAATPPLSRRSSLQSLSRRGSLSEAQAFSLAHSAASVVQAAQAKLAAIEQQSGPPCSGEDSSASEAEARRPRQSFGAPPRRPSHHHLAKALGPVPEMTTIQMPLLGVDAAPPPVRKSLTLTRSQPAGQQLPGQPSVLLPGAAGLSESLKGWPPSLPQQASGNKAQPGAAAAVGQPALQIKRGKRPSMEARRRKLDISALQGRRVLLAEDNLINQTVARKMLTSLGMHCEVASNGQEAVDIAYRSHAEGNCFSIILMDMAMPVMGGCDATRMLRRLGLDLPIVAMTANASDRDRDECLEAGMDGFLSKPVLKDRLAEAIMQVISGRARYKDEALALKALEGVGG